ncbi:hypothetical protein PHMEG_00025692 [Phytophthora megakarya]|uniref:Eukaryotic/viral aspartic protease n=1 Tax=Phytophthora megakarya TaxID=4795 RepID=A0A225VC89_9STRA|nr:hypothetical protein PHMEG_00025692 [Phytophthora megakarya]
MVIKITTRRSRATDPTVTDTRTADPRSTRISDARDACGELHDMGKCPMEEFYNQTRQWFNPTKHMDILPGAAEKVLNSDARRAGIRYEPSVLDTSSMHL